MQRETRSPVPILAASAAHHLILQRLRDALQARGRRLVARVGGARLAQVELRRDEVAELLVQQPRRGCATASPAAAAALATARAAHPPHPQPRRRSAPPSSARAPRCTSHAPRAACRAAAACCRGCSASSRSAARAARPRRHPRAPPRRRPWPQPGSAVASLSRPRVGAQGPTVLNRTRPNAVACGRTRLLGSARHHAFRSVGAAGHGGVSAGPVAARSACVLTTAPQQGPRPSVLPGRCYHTLPSFSREGHRQLTPRE